MAEHLDNDLTDLLERVATLSGLTLSEVQQIYAKAKESATMAELFDIPQSSLDACYTLAYNFYSSDKYGDAEVMFRMLCQYQHLEPKHWIGLGCTRQKQGDYQEAAICFSKAAQLGGSPRIKPLFLLAQCCTAVEDLAGAKLLLDLAIQLDPGKDPTEQQYFQLAKDLLANLPKE